MSSSASSRKRGPTSCTPSGRPCGPVPAGNVTQGVQPTVQIELKLGSPVEPSPSGASPAALGVVLGAAPYFGRNPDALWDAIGEYHGEPVEILWRNSAQSAARLARAFDDIVAVLKRADAQGRITLRLE